MSRDPYDELSALLEASDDRTEQRVAQVRAAVPDPPRWMRVALIVLAVTQAPLAAAWFFDADPFGLLGDMATDAHLVRDGALGLVISAGAGLTAWRPRWAIPTFVIASFALVANVLGGISDESLTSSGWSEAVHVTSIITTMFIGLAGTRLRPITPAARRPSLRAVDGSDSAAT